MANQDNQTEGNLTITGILKVLGKINSPSISELKSAVKVVTSQATTVVGALGAIVDQAADDNYLTTTEKKNLLTKWEEVKTEYPILRQGALDDGISEENILIVNFDAAYDALRTYCFVEPGVLSDSTTGEEINGAAYIAVWEAYYTYRSQLMSERITLKASSSEIPSGASYLGMFASAPTADYVGDWYTNSTTGLLYVWTGTAWSTSGITSAMRMWAMEDLLSIASTAAQTFASLLVAYEGFFETLVASEAFIDTLASSEAFIDTLVADDAFVAALSAIKIQAQTNPENNYWDLSSGDFRIGNETDYFIFDATEGDLTICLTNGRLVIGSTDPGDALMRVNGRLVVDGSVAILDALGIGGLSTPSESISLEVNGSALFMSNIGIYGGIRVDSSLGLINYLSGEKSQNTIYAALMDSIPDTYDTLWISGILVIITFNEGIYTYTPHYISRVVRTSSSQLTLVGIKLGGSYPLQSFPVNNGSTDEYWVQLTW